MYSMVFGQPPFSANGELLTGEGLLHSKKLPIKFPENQVLSHYSYRVTAVTADAVGSRT